MLALTLDGSADAPRLAVGEIDAPAESAGRVVVDVAFAGVTRTEPHWSTSWAADGRPRARPVVLGLEFAGRVRSVGPGVGGFSVGARVFGMAEPDHGGAIARQVSAPAAQMLVTPAGVSDEAASVLGLAGATAWQAIFRYGELRRGQKALIHGGAGGVGVFATQLAAWASAHVTVTAAGRDAALCRTLGADRVVDFERGQFEACGGDYDLVVDLVGGDVLERSWGVLRRGGRLITIVGETAPDQARARALGVTAKAFIVDSNLAELRALLGLVADGAVRAVIGRRFALASAADAFARQAGGAPGKTIVACSEPA